MSSFQITCPSCKVDIDQSANKCPHCLCDLTSQDNLRFTQWKRWYSLITIAFCIGLFLVGLIKTGEWVGPLLISFLILVFFAIASNWIQSIINYFR